MLSVCFKFLAYFLFMWFLNDFFPFWSFVKKIILRCVFLKQIVGSEEESFGDF